jgi:hypothetical protein
MNGRFYAGGIPFVTHILSCNPPGEEEIGKKSGLRAAIEAVKQDVERRGQARAG